MKQYSSECLYDMFDQLVDETESKIEIGIFTYSPSQVLREINGCDYEHMFNEWLDSMVDDGSFYEFNNEIYDEDPMLLITDTLKKLKVAS